MEHHEETAAADARRTRPAELIIRRAGFEDAAAIAGLVTQLGYPSTAEAIAARLDALLTRPQDHLAAVALWKQNTAGVIAATLSFHIEHDAADGIITALCVDQACRGQGIGRRCWITPRRGCAAVGRASASSTATPAGATRIASTNAKVTG